MADRKSVEDRLSERLGVWERQGLARKARPGNTTLLSFASNDYLGLAKDPSWRALVAANFARHPPSSSASRLAGGQTELKAEVEAEMAAFFGHERCLLFSSGWQANQAIVSALVDRGQPVFVDKEAHASVMTVLLTGRGLVRGFAHMDLDHLERRLARHSQAGLDGESHVQPMILVESLYGMGGEVLEPGAMEGIRGRHDPFLVVDEAHAMGVLGDAGRGVWHGAGANVVLGTLGKALGLFGAFVLCSSRVAKALENFAAPLVYSTSLPDAHAACCRELVRLLPELEGRREKLRKLCLAFKRELEGAGLAHRGRTHVVLLPMKNVSMTVEAKERLAALGFDVFCARYPTTPPNRPALRMSLSAAHEEGDVARLAKALASLLREEDGANVLQGQAYGF